MESKSKPFNRTGVNYPKHTWLTFTAVQSKYLDSSAYIRTRQMVVYGVFIWSHWIELQNFNCMWYEKRSRVILFLGFLWCWDLVLKLPQWSWKVLLTTNNLFIKKSAWFLIRKRKKSLARKYTGCCILFKLHCMIKKNTPYYLIACRN